jgi:hypothetical protein
MDHNKYCIGSMFFLVAKIQQFVGKKVLKEHFQSNFFEDFKKMSHFEEEKLWNHKSILRGRFLKLKNSSIHSQYWSKYTHQFDTFQMSPLRCVKYEL